MFFQCWKLSFPATSDPASFTVNLFLHFYENKWLLSTTKNYLVKGRKCCHVFRFVDDLCAINGNSEFEKNFKDTYPEELELKKESAYPHKLRYLTYQYILRKKSLTLLHMTKVILSHFPLSVCLTLIAICYLKYFMHPLSMKFCTLLEPALESFSSLTLQSFFRDACISLFTELHNTTYVNIVE